MTPADNAYLLAGVHQVKEDVSLLHDVTLRIPRGAATAVCGPSGAGKSTLLRLLNRLDDASRGEVRFMGRPIAAEPVRTLRQRVGFVFQTPVMFPGSVSANLAIAARYSGKPIPNGAEAARMLETVELDAGFVERRADALSGGEKQRVALARALVSCPEVLLLDEPTAALDHDTAVRLIATLKNLHQSLKLTIVMVSHQQEVVAAFCEHIIELAQGRVIGAAERAPLAHARGA